MTAINSTPRIRQTGWFCPAAQVFIPDHSEDWHICAVEWTDHPRAVMTVAPDLDQRQRDEQVCPAAPVYDPQHCGCWIFKSGPCCLCDGRSEP